MILFDTNVIIDLPFDDELRINVLKFVKKNKGIFCISLLSISEILDGKLKDKVAARLKCLSDIWDEMGPKGFHVFIGSRELIPLEARSQGDKHFLHILPQDYLDEIRKLFKGEITQEEFTAPIADMMKRERDDKVNFYKSDQQYRRGIEENIDVDQDEIEGMIMEFRGLRNFIQDYEIPAAVLGSIYSPLTKWRLRQIQQRHRGYVLIKTIVNMIVFKNLCNALSSSRAAQNSELTDICRISKGQWYDIAIAATASYADYFVTKDSDLLAFCEFLRGKNVLRFQALSVSQLYEALHS